LGGLFFLVAAFRRFLFRNGWLTAQQLPVPVVVIGNITAGGSGKTPLVLSLAEGLLRRGRRPGIVSRGYGGSLQDIAEVTPDSDAAKVGDEPLLLRRRADCPVFVGPDRVAAGHALLAAYPDCDLLLCDDGLQHYRLARDVEIAVVDRRGLMNGWPLPAGPLREPAKRLERVDAIVAHGWSGSAKFRMQLAGERFKRLGGDEECLAADLDGQCLHAVAGIGEPQRFFDHLAGLGLRFVAHAFPDHHTYCSADIKFVGDAILTTEKDAVKFPLLTTLPVWVLPVAACITPDLTQFILEKIDGRPPA
jgi:tetraacyldisaccharide 4'-kinase